jgi:hypothetical protein
MKITVLTNSKEEKHVHQEEEEVTTPLAKVPTLT